MERDGEQIHRKQRKNRTSNQNKPGAQKHNQATIKGNVPCQETQDAVRVDREAPPPDHKDAVRADREAPPPDHKALTHREKPGSGLHGRKRKAVHRAASMRQEHLTAVHRTSSQLSTNWKQLQKDLKLSRRPTKKQKTDDVARQDHKETKSGSDIWFDDVDKDLLDVPGSDIWFDDVDKDLLDVPSERDPQIQPNLNMEMSKAVSPGTAKDQPLVKTGAFSGTTRAVAMDCEMVGTGSDGQDSILGRVSIVNHHGTCIYDSMVQPTEKVTDYRTQFSGIHPGDLGKGKELMTVQREVSDIISGRVLVGHALHNDLKVLFLCHPRKNIRDTSKYKVFRSLFNGRTPSLRNLTKKLLDVDVQGGEHNSIEDAQAAMRLYTLYRKHWEKDIKIKRCPSKNRNFPIKKTTNHS